MINELVLVGRIGNTPVVETTKTGKKVVKFSIPLFHSYMPEGRKDEWLQCEVWGKLGGIVEKAQKGTLVAVRGEIHNESWKDSEGNWKGRSYITVDHFRFLEKRKRDENSDYIEETKKDEEVVVKKEEVKEAVSEVDEKKLEEIDEFLNSL